MLALSNTATPKYYGQFREKVLSGEIPVCQEIDWQMQRIDARIADPRFYYDPRAVEGFIKFCEWELTLTDGSDLRMLDTFKLWAEDLLGWYTYEVKKVWRPGKNGRQGRFVERQYKKRLTEKQYLIVARGAAKSMYAAFLQAYFLNVDTATTLGITTAPTMKQAEEVMSPIRTAITRARGPLFKFLTEGSIHSTTNLAQRQKLASTKKGIENHLTGSIVEIRPMSINKLQGARPKISTVDEWLSGDYREDVVGALEQGANKVPGWLIVASSSEGTVRNGPGDTVKMELQKILKGEYDAEHISIWHYKLDDIKEVDDPDTWPKAQPNLGITISYEAYHLDVERAEQIPATRNDILAKRFGIPMEGFTYFFTYEETEPHIMRRKPFHGMPCALGADLSQGDDFCAFSFLYPLQPGRYGDHTSFGVEVRSYITRLTFDRLPAAMRAKYQEFLREGTLQIMEGTVLDMLQVYDDLDAFIEDNEIDVRAFGYDPYNAREFVERWVTHNGEYAVIKVIQGPKTESVPLGELKILARERKLFFYQLLMKFAMGNAIVIEDTNGNRKLWKRRAEEKIDNVASTMDAYVAYKTFKEAFE